MAKQINFRKEIQGGIEDAVTRVSAALQTEGFGILTRIDLHARVREKLGKELPPVVILGACNPEMAYEAYRIDTDVTALLPCNTVLRELEKGRISVEIAKPTALLEPLGNRELTELAGRADQRLARVLESLR